MMENHGLAQIIGDTTDAPQMNMLSSKYGSATNYYGVTHPSLPNYLASISGDFQGIFDDDPAGPDSFAVYDDLEFLPAYVDSMDQNSDNSGIELLTAEQVASAESIPHWFSGRTIVDQLEEHGLTWKAYMGAMGGTGDITYSEPSVPNPSYDAGVDGSSPTDTGNLYSQKHNPFEYFSSIRTNANRMAKIVPMTQFDSDIAGSTMPNYVWISPDQCSDMHGVHGDTAAFIDAGFCTGTAADNDMSPQLIQYGDTYVGNLVKQIMAAPTWKDGSAIVVVFDEDDYQTDNGCCGSPTGVDAGVLGGGKVPAIVISSLVSGAVTSADPYNHYSLLATLQHIWGLDCLANTCGMTGDALMTKLFLP
jgi:hypothetical protein